MKIERMQNRAPPFKHPAPIEESTRDTESQLSLTMVDRPLVRQSTYTSASAPATTTAIAAKSKENAYVKPGTGKCYKCREPGHRSKMP